jgi:hypothetical protein
MMPTNAMRAKLGETAVSIGLAGNHTQIVYLR